MTRKPTPQGSDHFLPGAAVEISSNDDGFRGSWFTGTVLRRGDSAASPDRRTKRQRTSTSTTASADKLWIQFDTIFNDEAGTSPVKEFVHESQLRPLPPKELRQQFSLDDEVDAFFNDGWWEGVVTEDLGNGKYEIYFRASKESLQFEWENLRLHREWINNAWIPPFDEEQKAPTTNEVQVQPEAPNAKKVKAKAMPAKLKKGMLVEVSSDEDGYRGAWFLATIVKAISNGKFLIQYKHLRTDDDTDFVKEEMDSLHIRPCPPPVKMSKGFHLLDEVDALYNDGWWVGLISGVLKGSKFKVFFKDTDEELQFKASELRLHQEWMDGNWVVSSSKGL